MTLTRHIVWFKVEVRNKAQWELVLLDNNQQCVGVIPHNLFFAAVKVYSSYSIEIYLGLVMLVIIAFNVVKHHLNHLVFVTT